MDNIEKRYERKGTINPCSLDRNDLLNLTEIIQETFTKPEVDRYFRVSTTVAETRVFSNSIQDFLNQKELPPKATDLSFYIEGWDKESRFDKNILLDFSKYSIQLSVEGIDPVWVHDKYLRIVKYLKKKAATYWPLILLERFIIFTITILLIINIVISIKKGEFSYYIDKVALLGLWVFLVFYDTRKIWPYSNIRLMDGQPILSKANIITIILVILLIATVMAGTILPFLK